MTVAIIEIDKSGEKRTHLFTDPQELKYFWKDLKKSVDKKNTAIYAVDRKKATPPPKNTYRDSIDNLWCPYCKDDRVFVRNEALDTDQCFICGVSTNEYFVRKYNQPIFRDIKEDL